MSRLDELIEKLCPNGVPYVPMGSFMTKVTEKGKNDSSVTQVYVVSNTLGMVRAEDYRDTTIHSEDTSNYTIVRPGMVAYNPSRLNIGSIAMLKDNTAGLVSPMYVVFSIDEKVICKSYFEYLMKSSYVSQKIESFKEEGARFRFDFSRWNWIMVQVPPLEVQYKIVRILDLFVELSAELSAELKDRKLQYEYYAHKMLTFNADIPVVALESLARKISSGKNKIREADGEFPVYGSTGIISKTDIPVYSSEQILIARVGANAGYVHIAQGKYDVSDNTLMLDVNDSVILKYIYYVLKDMNLNQYAKGAGQPLITAGQLKKLEIPLPPIQDQVHIVEVLDVFNSICNDLSAGLPAEIKARQKQYEYYRDKLLTFEEKKEA